MVQIKLDDLVNIREKHKTDRIVYCSGSFDLLHIGHILLLEHCKNYGDILVVSVGDDEALKGLKGVGRPILNEKIRLKSVDSLKAVDYCLLNPAPPEDPLIYIKEIISRLEPDVYIINNDAFDIPYRQRFCDELNTKLVILEGPHVYDDICLTTTELIKRIKDL